MLICASSSCFHFGDGNIFISSLGVHRQQWELHKHTRGLTRPWNTSLCPCMLTPLTEMCLSLESVSLFPAFRYLCVFVRLSCQRSIRWKLETKPMKTADRAWCRRNPVCLSVTMSIISLHTDINAWYTKCASCPWTSRWKSMGPVVSREVCSSPISVN